MGDEMKHIVICVGALAPALVPGAALAVEPHAMIFWGVSGEQAEIRLKDGAEILAWDFDAFVGTDEVKFVLRSEAEYDLREDAFETLETQFRVAVPVTPFFDAVAGVRVETPEGRDRVDGVIGLHGLAPQWFEVDLDLFVSDDPSVRFEVEYEGLITNRLILTPSVEIELPLTDDASRDFGAFAPTVEIGARLSYDLIDRLVSPYVGVHYEFALGETADRIRASGGNRDDLFFVAGAKILF